MNVAKIHRKLTITESPFYFANISATKAQIFMKFDVVVNYYLVSLSFHEDSCINMRACKFYREYTCLQGSSFGIRPSIYLLNVCYRETTPKVVITVILGAKSY